MSNGFSFDPDQSAADNLAAFFAHLQESDPQLSAILKDALSALEPLPEGGAGRAEKRREANKIVRDRLLGTGEDGQ